MYTGPDPTAGDGNILGEKYCTHCGTRKKFEKFDVDNGNLDGRRDVCKECRAEIRKAEQEQLQLEAIQDMEHKSVEALGELASSGGSMTPHTSELLESVMSAFGGTHGYVKHLFATYIAAPPGSERRVKIHKMIFDLTQNVTQVDMNDKRLEEMPTEDIQRLMGTFIEEWQKKRGLPSNAVPTLEGAIADTVQEYQNAKAEGE